MSTDDSALRAAVAAGALGADDAHRALLDSVVQVARAIFAARAASITLWDEPADELVFEAVAGEGADRLVGTRFPADRGLAGWVLGSGQPLVIEDVAADPRFARDVAERSGYSPKGLMAVPVHGTRGPLGVLQVLDRPQRARFSLHETDLLGLFADQAAIAVEIVQHARRARALLATDPGTDEALSRLATALEALEGGRRARADDLVRALADLLSNP